MRIINPQKRAELMRSRLAAVKELAQSCRLCPRECGVNRLKDEPGFCQVGYGPVYSSANLHHGEEPPISGWKGSGTIFMTGCNLQCKFCQNFPISQLRNGNRVTIEKLAYKLLWLQKMGAHNINFVTPTHQAASLFEVVLTAYQKGLAIPLAYNSGGYEAVEMLRLWEGIVDVYMPDSKYACDSSAVQFSSAPDYVRYNRLALKEMHRQVGILQMDEDGIALQGLLVRHLVLPGDLSGTGEVLRFISSEISPQTYISLMSQYFPAWKALKIAGIDRALTENEYEKASKLLVTYGLDNGWTQPFNE